MRPHSFYSFYYHYLAVALFICMLLLFNGCRNSSVNGKAADVAVASSQPDELPLPQSVNKPIKTQLEPPDFSTELAGRDPLEGFNRSMYSINDVMLRYMFRPVGMVYGSILPRPAIEAIDNFCTNVEFLKRMLSCFLQAKFSDGGIESSRFLINTTLGVGGLFEVAEPWFGLTPKDEDFGQAFAVWGIGPGCFLSLPGIGPTNVRDGVGLIFDYALDPKTYIGFLAPGAGSIGVVNKAMVNYPDYEQLVRANADPYQLFKDMWTIRRQLQIEDWQQVLTRVEESSQEEVAPADSAGAAFAPDEFVVMAEYGSESKAADTLRVAMFEVQDDEVSLWPYLSFFNRADFISKGSICSVRIADNKRKMDYRFWPQPDNATASLAVILPGLGSHFSNSTLTALAELLYRNGYAVAALSNAMNWDFMETAASVLTPGFTPVDAADCRLAIGKVLDDLKANCSITPDRIVLVGYSLGGLHTLFISEMEKNHPLLDIDRYLAINPPVDLLYGLRRVDEYFNVWREWDKEEIMDKAVAALGKYLLILRNKYPWKDYPEPGVQSFREEVVSDDHEKTIELKIDERYQTKISEDEAKLLVGYSFKRTIEEIMVSIHRRRDLGVLKTPYSWGGRSELYRELVAFNFNDYVNKVLLKYYSEQLGLKLTLKELNRQGSMWVLAEHLKSSENIRVIHSLNDFLKTDEHRRWLKDILGDRCVFFEYGGHLGNLYLRSVHETILDMLKQQ